MINFAIYIIFCLVSTLCAHRVGLIAPLSVSDHIDDGISQLSLFQNLVPTILSGKDASFLDNICSLYLGYSSDDLVLKSPEHFHAIKEALEFFLPDIRLVWVEIDHYVPSSWSVYRTLAHDAVLQGEDILCLMSDAQQSLVNNWLLNSIQSLEANKLHSFFGAVLIYGNIASATTSYDTLTIACFHAKHATISNRGFDILPSDNDRISYSAMGSWLLDIYSPFQAVIVFPHGKILNMSKFARNDSLEDYIDSVQYWRRAAAMWLATASSTEKAFRWNPAILAYGPRDVYYHTYCTETAGYIC